MPKHASIRFIWLVLLALVLILPVSGWAEYEQDDEVYPEDTYETQTSTQTRTRSRNRRTRTSKQTRRKRTVRRKYFIPDPKRIDAGVFHVGFALGGNFYVEPKFDANLAPLGESFKDFGFLGGVYFDFDYEDIRLGLRGFVGYKYILNSVHVFALEGRVRYRIPVSDSVQASIGAGASTGVWFRTITAQSQLEEIVFLPAFLMSGGFDFNPFMVDLKFLINRVGENSTILGFELLFGFRL